MKHIFPLILLFSFLVPSKAQIGDPAPDFTVTDVHGQTHHLYDYLEAGKVVVLDFFYTTCGPCQYYSPQVNLAYEKYGCNNATTVFIAIDYGDTDAMVEAYDQEYQIQFPSVSGEEGGGNGVVSDYGVFSFPTFYVIDSTKKIVDQIEPPTLVVFDFHFGQLGIAPADCEASGLREIGVAGSLRIFPNPVDGGKVTVEWPATEEGLLEIWDLKGGLVSRQPISAPETNRVEVSLEGLTAGFFMVKVLSAGNDVVYFGKLIIEPD